MIVTTIVHSGDVWATAADVHDFLGDTAMVDAYYHEGVGIVTITRQTGPGREGVVFLQPNHKLISSDGGVTFEIKPVVINPEHEIERLQGAVDSWRARWLEESKEADRMGLLADRLESEVRELTAQLAEAKARLQAVWTLKVWKDDLNRGFVFSDELAHAVDPDLFPEPKPIRLDAEEAAA